MIVQCGDCGHVFESTDQEPFWIDDEDVAIRCPNQDCDTWMSTKYLERHKED